MKIYVLCIIDIYITNMLSYHCPQSLGKLLINNNIIIMSKSIFINNSNNLLYY